MRKTSMHHDRDTARTLLNAASDHALLLDLEGTILAANISMAGLFNLTPGELAGERIYDFLPGPEAAKWAEAVLEGARSGQPMKFAETYFEGRELEVRVHPVPGAGGRVDSVAVFCRDVTAQNAAARERTRLASALEQTADAVILFDEKMCVAYINQSFEAMTGYSLREVRGRPASTFYVGPEQLISLAEIAATLARGDAWTGKACNTCKDGSVICCQKSVAPIRGRGGCILGYVSVWRDVTTVETLERQLRQAQKMEAIGTLAGGIAHDLNNILSPIVLLADLGLCQLSEDDPLGRTFERILKATQRAGALVRQILGLSQRRETDQPVPFRISSILKECLKLLRPSLPSTIAITLDTQTENDVVLADPAQVHQLVMNLCTNAAWAMRGAGGRLELGIEEREVGKRDLEFPEAEPGTYVLLRVRDSGHGIRPEHLERIFDPFFTTRTDGSGTGLGLAVVHNVVRQLRGSIRVRSAPGQGACFEILLPRSCAPAPEFPVQDPGPGQRLMGSGRVLVADDEPDILEACAMGLRAYGYEVVTCLRGTEALELFRADSQGFDAVLSDTTMPDLAGPDLVRELLKIAPHLPVILTTGHSDLVSREKAWRLGALEYLGKPFHMDELAAVLLRLLGGRRRARNGEE
jgi:PAS domain S-box-containing protein